MTVIRVGTRQSQLALTQTNMVVDALKALHPDVAFELVHYKTTGDKLVHVSLQKIGGKGVFVKDIEKALVEKEIDIAVHSLKDVPGLLAEGCVIGASPEREDVRDCLIFKEAGMTLARLPAGSVVGTSSLRRQVQLEAVRPDLVYKSLRGNIDSRIQKVRAGQYDAIVLAVAGINRLGWTSQADLDIEYLDESICLPAVAQAALGIECRADDQQVLDILSSINHPETAVCAGIEREFLRGMGADCTFPIAALAKQVGADYQLEVMLADSEKNCHRISLSGHDGFKLAKEAVEKLNQLGVEPAR
ncbi:hydroxymethylbilane synthase [Streptococcus suis]|nr:hydroxymethylbilane synthase [Streptococcus suis]